MSETPSESGTVLTVFVIAYLLEENVQILRVGESVEWSLILREPDDLNAHSPTFVAGLSATATPLVVEHHMLGHHPTRLTVGSAELYWGAPSPLAGPTVLTGAIDVADAGYEVPHDFPVNRGTVERLRMVTTP